MELSEVVANDALLELLNELELEGYPRGPELLIELISDEVSVAWDTDEEEIEES
jgi:hypothetical protein